MNKLKLYAILFAEGFISVSLQILIMRQLIPFVGNSVVTISVIVAIFLMSLSVGYYFGGKIKSKYEDRLKFNFIISALIVAIGFSYYVIEVFFDFQFFSNVLINLFAYLLIFLTIPIFLLGQTIPILTNFNKEKRVSEVAGGALAINTIGAVLGSLATSMIALYFFGVANTVMINVLLLILISLSVSGKKIINDFINVIISCFIILLAFNLNVNYEKNKFIKTNHYNNYEVIDNSNIMVPVSRELILNNSLTGVNVNNKSAGKYIDYIRNYMFDFLKLRDKEFLILGAGGFTFTMGLDNQSNKFKYIDNDPEIKKIAENYFLKDKINGEFKLSDGRVYLNSIEDESYDVILVDVFTNLNSIPWHFITDEFMMTLDKKVKEGGHIIINTILKRDFSNNFSKRVHSTIINNLRFCITSPIIYENDQEYLNYVYICKKSKSDNTGYSDMYDRMSLDEVNYPPLKR